MSVGNDTYGITGIPSMVAGRGDREKSGTSRQHKGDLPRFGPQRCVKHYNPALVDVLVFLGSRTGCRCSEVRKAESLLSVPCASFYRRKGLPQWHTGGGKCYSVASLPMVLQDKTHLMRGLGVPLLYWGREQGPSRPSLLLLASTSTLASSACSAM